MFSNQSIKIYVRSHHVRDGVQYGSCGITCVKDWYPGHWLTLCSVFHAHHDSYGCWGDESSWWRWLCKVSSLCWCPWAWATIAVQVAVQSRQDHHHSLSSWSWDQVIWQWLWRKLSSGEEMFCSQDCKYYWSWWGMAGRAHVGMIILEIELVKISGQYIHESMQLKVEPHKSFDHHWLLLKILK